MTTRDALTYSTKAATHKHVHPYLRYGTMIGAFDDAWPGPLGRHGAYCDFMIALSGEEATAGEWSNLTRVRGRKRFRLLHRPLCLSESSG